MRYFSAEELVFPGEVKVTRGLLYRWACWFWFFIATVSMLIGIKYPLAAGFPQTLEGTLFFGLLTLSHWYALYFLLALLLFLPLILLLPSPRFIRTAAVLLALPLLSLVLVDAFSFSLFRFHLNGMVFSLLFGGAADEVFTFDLVVYLYALLGLLGTIVLVLWLNHLAWRMARRRNPRGGGYKLALLIAVMFMAQNFWFALASALGNHDITRQARLYPVYLSPRADRELLALGLVDEASLHAHESPATGVVDYPKRAMTCELVSPRPNIFIVVIDSWRFDALSAAITPNVHALSTEAMVFNRHYSGGNNTRTGLFSLLYGLPATYWETFLDARLGSELIRTLQRQEYQLAIYASAKLISPEFDKTIFADVVDLRRNTKAETVYGRDVLATQEFAEYIKKADKRPIFGLLFYDAPHSYAYAERYRDYFKPAATAVNYFSLGKDSDPEPLLNLYRNSVISVDALVGEAFAAIKEAGLWDNAIIIVTGDHSQEFNDNGLGEWGHNGNYTDAQIHVPMVVKWPGHAAAQNSYVTTHYDVVPTLLSDALGCSNEFSDYSVGQSLFIDQPRKDFLVGGFADFGVRREEQIYSFNQFGGTEVLDLNNRPLSIAPDASVIKESMEQTSRYYLR